MSSVLSYNQFDFGEEGGEAPAQLCEAADVFHLVHCAEFGVFIHFTFIVIVK